MLPARPVSPKQAVKNFENPVSRYTLLNSSSASNIYLRIKPNSEDSSEQNYTVLNSTTFLAKKGENVDKKFTFTRIFDSSFSQADFFQHSVRQQITKFLLGENLTILAYGATSSGKTYTMYGTPESPGIIPRSIEFLFSEVNCTLAPWYKMTDDGQIVALDACDRDYEIQSKEDIINPRVIGKEECALARLSLNNSTPRNSEWENRELSSAECMSSVWISVAEIYNENVYDLLVASDQERRPLKVTTRKDGSTFVNGLKSVHVTTALEACQLLVFVQSRMTIANAAANATSSQSHTFLTVKLLTYRKEDTPEEVRVSALTFFDVAGSRRSKKTEEAGLRQTESRSINNSLLVLGRCMKHVRDSHSFGDHVAGPFRESKLTRMLQKVLAGREKVSFVVTIDTAEDTFPETLSVLAVSAMAKRLGLEPRTLKRNVFSITTPRSMKSSGAAVGLKNAESNDFEGNEVLKRQNRKLPGELQAVESASSRGQWSSAKVTRDTQTEFSLLEFERLKEENERLKEKLKAADDERVNRELEVRQELADRYSVTIDSMAASWKKRVQDVEEEGRDLLKWSVDQVETFYKERIDSITRHKKRKRDDNDGAGGIQTIYEDLEAENAMVTSKVVVLREMVRGLRRENELLSADRNKSSFETVLIKEKLVNFHHLLRTQFPELFMDTQEDTNELDQFVRELRSAFDEKTRTNEALEEGLEQAKEEAVKIVSKSLETEKKFCDAKILLREMLIKMKDIEKETREEDLRLRLRLLREEVESVKENIRSSSPRNDSAWSDDSFYNDSISAAELVTQARVGTKEERLFNCYRTSAKEVSLSSIDVDIDRHTFRSSDSGNIKEDSGIDFSCRSQRSISINGSSVTQERSTQTEFHLRDSVDDCRLADANSKPPRDKELSQKLNDLNFVIGSLQKVVDLGKEEVALCKEKLISCETKMEKLEREKEDLARMREVDSRKYDHRIGELAQELLDKEEEENRNLKRLKNSLQKCAYIENQLSVLGRIHEELEECFVKGKSEHISRMEKLERVLSGTAIGADDATEQKSEIDDAVSASNANGENLKCLGEQIARSNEGLRVAKESATIFGESPEKVKDSESQSTRQREELSRLQSRLLETEQELRLIKKQRRHLITKYECTVQHLRIEVEKKKKQLVRLQKLIFSNLSKRCRKHSYNGEEKLRKSMKFLGKKDYGEKSISPEIACLFDGPPCASLENSECSIKSKDLDSGGDCKSEQCCTTESSSGLNDSNLDVRQIQSDASDCSEVPCGCGIGFKNAPRQGRMSGWMKVKRSSGRTDLLRRLDGEYCPV